MKSQEKILLIANDPKSKWKSLGTINLEYGGIVICDPLARYNSRNRLQRTVEPGTYEVSVLEKKSKQWGNRYAYAQILFSEEEIKKSIVAKFTQSDSFSVDSGLACFMDIIPAMSILNSLMTSIKRRKAMCMMISSKLISIKMPINIL